MDSNSRYVTKEQYMISDIRNNSTSEVVSNKTSDRMALTVILTSAVLFLWLILLHGRIMRLFKIQGFIPKALLFVLFSIGVYIFSIETFVFQRKKKDRQIQEIMARGGDMVSHFMKIKDIKRRNFGLPFNITVIESTNTQIIPMEITYTNANYYSRFIDAVIKSGATYQEYQLKGKISLFDKFRSYYPKFKGEELIKILEAIYRENERVHESSPSRRCYIQLNVGYSSDVEAIITAILRSSRCKIQFLDEKMYKIMLEKYFGAPVNLEKMKAQNIIRNISLEDTKIVKDFANEEDLEHFIKNYNTAYVRPITKYTLKGGKMRNAKKNIK